MRFLATIVVGVVALTLGACASSSPTPTGDVEWGGGTGIRAETPASTRTAMSEAESGTGTPLQIETPSSTPTATSEVGADTATPTQAETPLATAGTTPTPAGTPIVGQSEPSLDRQARDEQRRRKVMENIPVGMKTWIDQDTIVYLVPRDAHDLEGGLVAVAHDMPTGTGRSYELETGSDGQARIRLHAEKTRGGSQGEVAALRLEQDPRVETAALQLLTTVERWSKK